MDLSELKLIEFACAKAEDSVMELAKKMKEKEVRNIFIIDSKGRPEGVVSMVDVNNKVIAENKDYRKVKAKDIMNFPVWTVDEKESLGKAYTTMLEKKRYALPITRKSKIIGILPMGEALKGVIREKRNASSKSK